MLYIKRTIRIIVLFTIFSLHLFADDAEKYRAQTTQDPTTSKTTLKHLLRPLSQDELDAELKSWLDILQETVSKSSQLLIQLEELRSDPEPDKDRINQLQKELDQNRSREVTLILQTNLVIEELEAKGGPTEKIDAAKKYIKAISDKGSDERPIQELSTTIGSIKKWYNQEGGGERLVRRILVVLLNLVIFWAIVKLMGYGLTKLLDRRRLGSKMLTHFISKTSGIAGLIIGMLFGLGSLGVEIAPLLAAFGAGGFVLAFALQETLGNFASGLMIMVYRPFDVDDLVEVDNVTGTVEKMSLVSTTLRSADNKELIVPNKKAWGETIINYTSKSIRRIDLEVGIGYNDDIEKACTILKEVADNYDGVLDKPSTSVGVKSLGDSSVNLFVRPWVHTSNYFDVKSDLIKMVKQRFDKEGISIPFPQREVHISETNSNAQVT